MKINQEDLEILKKNHPHLRFKRESSFSIIQGIFDFVATYDPINKTYILNPKYDSDDYLEVIEDQYQIKIKINERKDEFPKVYEIGGRIEKVAKLKNKKITDLHTYEDGKLCLVGPLDENDQMDLNEILDKLILQFFYDQSYYEKYEIWPRGYYSHGLLGFLENYNENNKLSLIINSEFEKSYIKILNKKNSPKGHHNCLCGSNRKFRDCHPKLFQSLVMLHNTVRSNKKFKMLILNWKKIYNSN